MMATVTFVIFSLAFFLLRTEAQSYYLTQQELNYQFEKFKNDYDRHYSDENEESFRKNIFSQNLNYIYQHNSQPEQTFQLGVNNFADLTNGEFRKRMNGNQRSTYLTIWNTIVCGGDNQMMIKLPDSVDWTTKGVVSEVKDQGKCGSCWAFSTVASIESQHALKTGKLVSLSEQNLVDCSDNHGCFGGSVENAFQYVIGNHGIDTESAYPYSGQYFHPCNFTTSTIGATISQYVQMNPTGSELTLQSLVANVGPISVSIDASHPSFQLYKSGIYNEPQCSTDFLDHSVTVVGYGITSNGTQFWKVKNSFGKGWGEQGYIRMSRNAHNQCGIATEASYPVI